MTALYIILGILLLFAALLLVKISFRICYCGQLLISFKVGFIKKDFSLLEKKEVKIKEEPEIPQRVKKAKKEEEKVPLKQIIPIIKETLTLLFEKTKRHIFLEKYILKITVATEDPAQTGIIYGIVAGGAASLLRMVEGIRNKSKKQGQIYTEVKPDFIAEKPDIYIDIILSTRVWRGLSMALTLSEGYTKYKKLKTKGA
ncbi:MAG: hypothetical protein ACOX3X_07550 [Eubacteriales bacterium]|jgi:hypothetical protein